jgi:hypothetical protein
MRFAYADPPYPAQASRHYGDDPSGICAEVNHRILVEYLSHFDAWALSTNSPSLGYVLSLCPIDVRIGAWVKPFAVFKPNVNPAYAWEPVIFSGGRKRERSEMTVPDWVSANITLRTGTHGAKPLTFAYWVFRMLNAIEGDEFVDVFPGTSNVSAAWDVWCRQGRLYA